MPAPTAKRPPAFHQFTGRDLPWLVDTQAAVRGHRPYLIWESFVTNPRVWTFAQFAEETRAYAAGLVQAGVRPGEFVLLHMENCPEFLFLWHACSRIGAVVVTTNTHSTLDELSYFADQCGAAVAITQPKFVTLMKDVPHKFRWIASSDYNPGEEPQGAPGGSIVPLSRLRGDPRAAPSGGRDPLAINSVQYTSGTTSRPKGVAWTQANGLWAARTMASHMQLQESDCTVVHFPLFHTNALAYSMLSSLWAGSTAVLTPRFSASRFWDIAVRNKCTWASMSLFPLRALMTQPDPAKHFFRIWAFAGDLEIARKKWGIRTTGWYGMTETVAACIVTEQNFAGPEGAMGRPVGEYEVSIRRDDGSEVSAGETGNLFIRGIPGLSLFYEYLNNPEATASAFDADGWFDTGDEITARGDGSLFFIGRAKDMLKVGGENVAALEIETVIAAVPGVAECAVVGKPDKMYDEVPVAFVVAAAPSPDLEKTILGICAERLSTFKRPHEVRFIDALPTGLLGKILKRDLREMVRRDSE
jgi:carnitine-CoA ligase